MSREKCEDKYEDRCSKVYKIKASQAITTSMYDCTLIRKENQIFLIYKEIQSGAVAKSYMRKGFLIYEEMRKYFPIYEAAVSHI